MLFRLLLFILSSSLIGCASNNKDFSEVNNLEPTHASASSVNLLFWSGISGKNIRTLTRNARFPGQYDQESSLSKLDFIDSKGDKYAQRVQAILEVPVSGSYQFWIAADESAELWLSNDQRPENKRLLAFVNKPSGYQIWDRYNTQKSKPVQLESNTSYYIEVLHKEHIGTDYLTVAWSGPDFEMEVLGSEYLSEFTSSEFNGHTYEEGYHNGYQAGSLLAPYDNRYPVLDTDNDGLPDFYENIIGLDIHDPYDAELDTDGDLLTNREEYALLTNPRDDDTDSDGIPDGYEVLLGLNAVNANDALLDLDSDGVNNIAEYLSGTELDNSASYPSKKNIALTWLVPTKRVDGSILVNDEIKGYKIYLGAENKEMELVAMVEGHSTVSWESEDLEVGIYNFSISTVTTNGNESVLSEPIEIQI